MDHTKTKKEKAEELKKQVHEKLQKENEEIIQEAEKVQQESKQKDLEEEMQKWEAARAERIKKFIDNREEKGKVSEEGEQAFDIDVQRRRARTLASSSPVTHFFQPPQPTVGSGSSIVPRSTSSAKKKRIGTPTPETTQRPVPEVPLPKQMKLDSTDIITADGKVNIHLLKEHFLGEGRLTTDAALAIFAAVEPLLRKEPNLLELEAPITVVGDIHGQFYDLVNMMNYSGDPSNTHYLFLGDYVDRGTYGCEVCFLLLSYKINYPTSFYLLRGNHESRLLTSHFNFKHECFYKYGVPVYDALMNVFDCLPVAALINNHQGSFLCTHGGLSPDIVQLDDIEDFDRFMEPPESGALCDLLWSDPIEESTALGLSEEDMEEWFDIDYVPNPTRGCGYIFGYAAVAPFLENNNLLCLIRAHEVQKDGYHCHYYWKRDQEYPLTITIFSAPNYCDMYGNQAGFIKFDENDFDFHQVSWVEHPYGLPNFLNAITYSLPYALEGFTRLCAYILEGCMIVDDEEGDEEIRQKVNNFGKMGALIRKIRERSEDILAGTVNISDEVSKFEKALKLDTKNEKRPLAEPRKRRSQTNRF